MIGEIIRNSSINAKMHAKMRKGLNSSDYTRLVNMHSVSEIAEYLKEKPRFKDVFDGIDPALVHRGQLESMLHQIMTTDIRSFLAFSGTSAKFFLRVFAIKNEIEYIKILLRRLLLDSRVMFRMVGGYENEFYNKVDFTSLANAKNYEEFVEILKPTIYYKPLRGFKGTKKEISLFAVESALDRFYRRLTESYMSKYLSRDEEKIVQQTFGANIDLDNIMYIVRGKTFYKMDNELIKLHLGDKGYRLTREEIKDMINAQSDFELGESVLKTPYGKLFEGGFENIGGKIDEYALNVHRKAFKKRPYSIESILYYIKMKEIEIKNIIMIVEGVRYGLSSADIKKYLIGIEKR